MKKTIKTISAISLCLFLASSSNEKKPNNNSSEQNDNDAIYVSLSTASKESKSQYDSLRMKFEEEIVSSNLTLSDLSENEKAEAIQALINGNCYYKGIKLWGKVKFVTSYPDIKIQYVESYPDIKVKFVSSYPDKCGLWQITESYPDFKVQIVTSYPDIKVKVVESYPGVD